MNKLDNPSDMNRVIPENLKNLRAERKLSLGEVSELTGVSKSMLGQIERGESSPTIATLWKIATGLGVSFTALLESSDKEIEIIKEADMTPLLSDFGHFKLFPVVPSHKDRSFEVLDLELDEDAISDSKPHAPGTEEFTFVYEGALEIVLGGEEKQSYTVERGCLMHYRADQHHTYKNAFAGTTKAMMVIHYPQGDA
jgi:transcriptional regulator with XRE-family HTH domain